MAVTGLACSFAVDAGQPTYTCEGAVMGGAGAACSVVAGFVGTTTEGADDGALADRALGDGVVEGMASVAPTEDGECCELFDCSGAAKQGGQVADELGEAGAIGVDESKGDGGVAFLSQDRAVEPLGGVDEREPFTGGVTREFFNEGHRGRDIAFCVTFNGDAVDDDFGVSFLWDDACPGAER